MTTDPEDDTDAALAPFLAALAADIEAHPERPVALNADLVAQIEALTAGVEADLDAELDEAICSEPNAPPGPGAWACP